MIEHVSNQAATLASIDIGAHNLVNAEANRRRSRRQRQPSPVPGPGWLGLPVVASIHYSANSRQDTSRPVECRPLPLFDCYAIRLLVKRRPWATACGCAAYGYTV